MRIDESGELMKKNLFQLFAVLIIVPIGIYASYRYVQALTNDISLTIGIMLVSTVIFFIITFVLYKMGYGERGRDK